MIKYANIFIYTKKITFTGSVNLVNGFDKDKDLEDEIEFQIDQLIETIAKCKHLPKFIIKKLIDKKIYSLYISKYTLYNINKFSEDICTKQYEKFKSEPFCNNERLASYIIETSSNKTPSQRNLVFGNDNKYSISVRRELCDYNIPIKFYQPGDIVKIRGFDKPFIIGVNCYDRIGQYNFSNIYDVFCIKDLNIAFYWDNMVKYDDITELIGHDIQILKDIINKKYSYVYKSEYIEEIMNMTE